MRGMKQTSGIQIDNQCSGPVVVYFPSVQYVIPVAPGSNTYPVNLTPPLNYQVNYQGTTLQTGVWNGGPIIISQCTSVTPTPTPSVQTYPVKLFNTCSSAVQALVNGSSTYTLNPGQSITLNLPANSIIQWSNGGYSITSSSTTQVSPPSCAVAQAPYYAIFENICPSPVTVYIAPGTIYAQTVTVPGNGVKAVQTYYGLSWKTNYGQSGTFLNSSQTEQILVWGQCNTPTSSPSPSTTTPTPPSVTTPTPSATLIALGVLGVIGAGVGVAYLVKRRRS